VPGRADIDLGLGGLAGLLAEELVHVDSDELSRRVLFGLLVDELREGLPEGLLEATVLLEGVSDEVRVLGLDGQQLVDELGDARRLDRALPCARTDGGSRGEWFPRPRGRRERKHAWSHDEKNEVRGIHTRKKTNAAPFSANSDSAPSQAKQQIDWGAVHASEKH